MAIAEDFQTNLQGRVERASGRGLSVSFPKVVFDAIAAQQFVTKDFFLSGETRLPGEGLEALTVVLSAK